MDSADVFERRKLELIEQLDDSRNSLLGSFILIDEQLEDKRRFVKECSKLPQKVATVLPRGSIQKLGIAAVTGLFLSRIKGRKQKKVSITEPSNSGAFKNLIWLLIRPMLQKAVLDQSRSWLTKFIDKRDDSRQSQL